MKAHVVTHTHWDREWYTTFEIFRKRLVNMLDEFLSEVQKRRDFKHFMLDGQTVVLEDYLELRPGKKEELVELIRSGKIAVGPWYILPDEFLITGESLIRNFLYGQRVLKNLSVPSMRIGYLPDMFGHNAYTPTVLKGLGMDWAVLWRGVGKACRDTEFVWKSPNGDTVKAVSLLYEGYSNGAHFGLSLEELKKRFKKVIEELSKHATTENLLIMNGTDHEMPLLDLPEHFKDWERDLGVELIHSTLQDYVSSVERENPTLKEVVGELRDPTYEFVLKDVTSTRMYIKLMNFEDQLLYTRYLEPLSTIDPTDEILNEIDRGWKEILKSHPHDSICGCSVDRVHKDVETRLSEALESGLGTLGNIVGGEGDPNAIAIFNPAEISGKRFTSAYVFLEPGVYELSDENGNRVKAIVERLSPEDLPGEISNIGKFSTVFNIVRRFQRVKSVSEVFSSNLGKLLITADLPKLCFKRYEIVEKAPLESSEDVSTNFENDFYEFQLKDDGTFSLFDKINGVSYESLNLFEDVADAGDEYNFSYLEGDVPIHPMNVSKIGVKNYGFVKRIDVKGYLEIPESLSSDRKSRVGKIENPVRISYTLFKDKPRVDVDIALQNRSKDHKLVVSFKVPERIEEVVNDGYFGLVKHPTEVENDPKATEEIVPRYAMESLVALLGSGSKFLVITRGIHEYETSVANDGTKLSLTLLRAVGWLSRGDLLTRKNGAGPYFPTPDAQCIREHVYRYSIVLLKEGSPEEIFEAQRDFLVEPLVIHPGTPKRLEMPIEFRSDRGIFMSSLKVAEDRNGIIARFFNVSRDGKTIEFEDEVELVNMAEESLGKSGRIFEIPPGKVLNVRFSPKS